MDGLVDSSTKRRRIIAARPSLSAARYSSLVSLRHHLSDRPRRKAKYWSIDERETEVRLTFETLPGPRYLLPTPRSAFISRKGVVSVWWSEVEESKLPWYSLRLSRRRDTITSRRPGSTVSASPAHSSPSKNELRGASYVSIGRGRFPSPFYVS